MYEILLFLVFVTTPTVIYFTVNGGFEEIFEKKSKYDYSIQIKFLDDSLWVKKVIESCNSRKQIWVTNKLITCFKNKYYKKVEQSLYNTVCRNLENYWDEIENKYFLQEIGVLNECKIRKRSQQR